MLKICMLVLTMTVGNQPTLINFNEVLAIKQGEPSVFNTDGTKVYFVQGSALGGQASISVKETVADIILKAEQCNGTPATYRIIR